MALKVVYREMAAGGIRLDWASRLSGAKRRYHKARLKGGIDGECVIKRVFQDMLFYTIFIST